MFTLFFIRRPIVACVISILIVLMGVVAFPTLPIAQYPDLAPPLVSVTTTYPGASASVVADTVAAPIEQQVNGVDGMIYMQSTSASDGSYTLLVSFEVGRNPDICSVLVQNKVSAALAQLPDEVKRIGVVTLKKSVNIVSVAALAPKDEEAAKQYDDLFLSNYVVINVNDRVKRIKGVGDTAVFPAKNYGMRIWLDPDKLKALDLTVVDITNALREQNVQVAAGIIGQPPAPKGQAFQLSVSTLGRLQTPEQFNEVIVKTSDRRITRLKDVARVELGAQSYMTLARTNGVPSAVIVVYQSPGGNAVQVAQNFKTLIGDVSRDLPPGLEFRYIYDTSNFVLSAVEEVYKTLIEAVILVLIVVLVFLGSIRSTVIPIAAIPVSIVGTVFFMKMFGFSINMPVLFGLVLAIGIVVDDAIVVVENVERVMTTTHAPPKQATARAMIEVFGAIVAISLVLMAVFLPTAALPGISGSLYRQFALTIAASTFLSAVCALTLSPALAGVILKEHKPGHKPNWFNRGFNKLFDWISSGYAHIIRVCVHPAAIGFSLIAFGASVFAIAWSVTKVPTGFVPDEDKGLILTEIWMPDAASQQRTLETVKKVEAILKDSDGVQDYTALPGFSIINGNGSQYALIFAGLKDWKYRVPRQLSLQTMIAQMQARTAQIPDAIIFSFYLPAIEGVGNAAGFDLRIQDRGNLGPLALQTAVQDVMVEARKDPRLGYISSGFSAGVPQLFAQIDREKVKKLGIPLQDVFSTLSTSLGSTYVNDFNKFGRTWQVNLQADQMFRARVEDVARLQVRNAQGQMVPLGSVLKMEPSFGPDRTIRYNLYPSVIVNGAPAKGISSGQSLAIMEELLAKVLSPGQSFEWSSLSYQEKQVSGEAAIVFILALVVVYLILSALYENWFTPLSVILSIPLAVLGAMAGLMYRGMDNNIYTQVGLVLLVGLGAKNAILIVEFARANRIAGKPIIECAVEASRMRLRPILMTAFAFILGVLPLVTATGAGAASRQAIGTAVFFGMIGNTFLGLFFTPILWVAIQWVSERILGAPKPEEPFDLAALTGTPEAKPGHGATPAPTPAH